MKTFWRCLEDVFARDFEDVLKASWRRVEDVLLIRIYWSWSRRLEDVFWRWMSKGNVFVWSKRLEDVLKTSSENEDERCLHQDKCLLVCYFNFHLPTVHLFVLTCGKSSEDVYHSLPHVSVIKGNILIAIVIFVCYYLLLASNRIFMTESMYLSTIQICQSLNEHYYYLISASSVVWQIHSMCLAFPSLIILHFHIRFRLLETNLVDLISNFCQILL